MIHYIQMIKSVLFWSVSGYIGDQLHRDPSHNGEFFLCLYWLSGNTAYILWVSFETPARELDQKEKPFVANLRFQSQGLFT